MQKLHFHQVQSQYCKLKLQVPHFLQVQSQEVQNPYRYQSTFISFAVKYWGTGMNTSPTPMMPAWSHSLPRIKQNIQSTGTGRHKKTCLWSCYGQIMKKRRAAVHHLNSKKYKKGDYMTIYFLVLNFYKYFKQFSTTFIFLVELKRISFPREY